MKITIPALTKWMNILEMTGVMFALLMAFIIQFALHELPCPLCLLQRVGFLSIAFGFLLNIRFGRRPSHYAIALMSAIYTSFVALRQIALHVVPGTGSYGQAFMGLHLYTWSYVASMLVVFVTIVIMGMDKQYQPSTQQDSRLSTFIHLVFGVMFLLVAANLVSLFLECGFSQCPDDPTRYLMLDSK